MAHWLVKSEPSAWSFADQVAAGAKGTSWNGVRNHAAKLNLMAMKVGEEAFFYHSNEGKEIVGIVEIVREHYLDPKDPAQRFPAVDVAPVAPLAHPVTLAAIKATPALADLALVRQSRLSVVPVGDAHWATIMAMSEAAAD